MLEELIKNSFEFKMIKKNSNLKIPYKSVPVEIQNWVNSTVEKKLREYTLIQGKEVSATTPWHEADREYYKMFKLLPDGQAKETGFEFVRSGMEGDGVVTGKEIEGTTKIPSGFVMVVAGTYPPRAEIYTSDDAQMFLPRNDIELSDDEISVLYWARSLTASSRPILDDKSVYDSLIQKGLLKRNKSITLEGKNILENSTIKTRLNQLQRSNTFKHWR